jgi:arabinogalactan oligomer / maltooligosaccharide transport system permease protein
MRSPPLPVQVAVHAGLVAFTAATLYPILWVLRMSVSPGQGFQSGLSPIPQAVSTEHFASVMGTVAADGSWLFARQLLNSLVVSTATAAVGVAMATSAAYALSRFRFPGREGGMDAFLVTQMFPSVLMAVPLYVLLDKLGLLDALSGLVLVYATTSVPFSTFTLKGFFDTLPRDLEEAAMLDGASRLQTFVRIILPLTRPALAVTFLFSFMTAWNEFVLANTLLSDPRAWTLPMVLQRYVDDYGTQWGHFAAGAILVSAPVVLLFFALQRHFVEGLTAGAVKG